MAGQAPACKPLTVLLVAISKAALHRQSPGHHPALFLLGTPGPGFLLAPLLRVDRPWAPAFILKVTPGVRGDKGFIDSLSKQSEAEFISHHPPLWRQEQSGQRLFSNPVAIQVWTNDPSEGRGCKLLQQIQSSDKCKECAKKRLQNTSAFCRTSLRHSLVRKRMRCQERRAGRWEGLCLLPRQGFVAGFAVIAAKTWSHPEPRRERGAAEVPWVQQVKQCLAWLQGSSFHHPFGQEVTPPQHKSFPSPLCSNQ